MNKDEILEFQVKKNVIGLYKFFLILIEDLKSEHDRNFDNLFDALPDSESLLNQADYFDEEQLARIRKKILDNGNDCLRNILETINKIKD
jgi:hypothetical protein